jgi:hypothetical protein
LEGVLLLEVDPPADLAEAQERDVLRCDHIPNRIYNAFFFF